ncbi:MAG: cobalamin-binding protein [Candidatus Omnitrophica bacterium]|nr:cobalamin-binding protein [Candidatus Omnitrophota bacterium]
MGVKYKSILALFLLFFSGTSYADHKRVVSLAPSITEEIYLLGAEDSLIGVTSYCRYPEEARNKEIIGTVLEPSMEKIVSLKPDLVLATNEGNRQESIKKLAALGLNVVAFNETKGFRDIERNFLRLGVILGRFETARQIMDGINAKIEAIRKESAAADKIKIFWQLGARPIVSASAGTFTDEIINWAGGVNIFSDMAGRYPRVSIEEVIKRNPEIIIVVTMGDITGSELDLWRRFPGIDAVRNNRVYVYDMHFACTPTPDNFIVALEKTAGLVKEARQQ